MRSFEARTALGAPAQALMRGHEPGGGGPREEMGYDVPEAVRKDPEFQLLFRASQKIKNSRRPEDQKQLAHLLNQMRIRWGELTGEAPTPAPEDPNA